MLVDRLLCLLTSQFMTLNLFAFFANAKKNCHNSGLSIEIAHVIYNANHKCRAREIVIRILVNCILFSVHLNQTKIVWRMKLKSKLHKCEWKHLIFMRWHWTHPRTFRWQFALSQLHVDSKRALSSHIQRRLNWSVLFPFQRETVHIVSKMTWVLNTNFNFYRKLLQSSSMESWIKHWKSIANYVANNLICEFLWIFNS